MASLEEKLQTLLQPAVEDLGCELWGIDCQRAGRFSTVRLYIDKPEGVSIDDCADVSRQVSAILDVEDPISEKYNLEVSSPGLDRQLFTLEQMARYVGQEVAIHLRIPTLNRRKWQGELTAIDNDMITLKTEGETHQFAFGNIQKAHLIAKIK